MTILDPVAQFVHMLVGAIPTATFMPRCTDPQLVWPLCEN